MNHRDTGRTYWRSLDELSDTPEFRTFMHREFPAGASELMEPGPVSQGAQTCPKMYVFAQNYHYLRFKGRLYTRHLLGRNIAFAMQLEISYLLGYHAASCKKQQQTNHF